ncbi:dihydrolipoyl dehydrogenase [Candidatus Woesearchaeota archaeon]|nr:dihydrolipoyl dehydrogenase [Candidatus Woesearchaeota archaeon]
MKKYDLIVIGAGAGTKVSTPASIMGKKTAIVEEWKLGGTCLNRGCIPSKMLIHPADVIMQAKEAKKLGVNVTVKIPSFSKITSRISKVVDSDSSSIGRSYKNAKNLDYYHGHAEFVSDKVIKVTGKLITAPKIVIASGAEKNVPPIPGLKGTPFMTSTEALGSKKLPKKLLIIGGGYIACELGHAYSSYGSDVTYLLRYPRFLVREDQEVSEVFTKVFKKTHKTLFEVGVEKIAYNNKKFTITIKDKKNKIKKVSGDALLLATGVKPNSKNLGLENTKIKTNKFGFIKVNKHLETAVKGVYAMGDVVGNYMFRHSANFEGEYLLKQLFGKSKKPIKYPPMPYAVFTHPEIGAVGPTEEELKAKKIKYVTGINLYKQSAQGMARLSELEFCKLILDKKTKKLISARILGDESATMIHQLIYAMTFGATVDDLLNMIYVHPALPEIVRNAARKAKIQLG